MNSDNATEAVHALNLEPKEPAKVTECGYVETGQVFHLANSSPSDGYIDKDNIHITLRGGDKLVECLQIKLKDKNRKVTKIAAYNKKTNHQQFAPAPQAKQVMKPKTAQAGRQPTTDPNRKDDGRPLPIQMEYDFCGYCGEPGHQY